MWADDTVAAWSDTQSERSDSQAEDEPPKLENRVVAGVKNRGQGLETVVVFERYHDPFHPSLNWRETRQGRHVHSYHRSETGDSLLDWLRCEFSQVELTSIEFADY